MVTRFRSLGPCRVPRGRTADPTTLVGRSGRALSQGCDGSRAVAAPAAYERGDTGKDFSEATCPTRLHPLPARLHPLPAPVRACFAACVLCCSCERAALLPRAPGARTSNPSSRGKIWMGLCCVRALMRAFSAACVLRCVCDTTPCRMTGVTLHSRRWGHRPMLACSMLSGPRTARPGRARFGMTLAPLLGSTALSGR